VPAPTGAPSDRGGRGQGRGRGRGDSSRGGRAAAPPRPPPPEMTASGPFAMGPSLAGSSAWRSGPRVSTIPTAPRGPPDPGALGANLTKTAAPALKKEERTESHVDVDDDAEVYSDPDEGVEIVDMRNVHTMDWMAPESLKMENPRERSKKRAAKAKKEEEEEEQTLTKGKGTHSCWLFSTQDEADSISLLVKQGPIATEVPPADDVGDINLANALDLSESEEEEVMEDIINDFAHDSEVSRLHVYAFPGGLIFILTLCRTKAYNKNGSISSSSRRPFLLSSPSRQSPPMFLVNKAMPPNLRLNASRSQPIQSRPLPYPKTWIRTNLHLMSTA
jgi:DNA-directed RNA polymerase III subunit RPC4